MIIQTCTPQREKEKSKKLKRPGEPKPDIDETSIREVPVAVGRTQPARSEAPRAAAQHTEITVVVFHRRAIRRSALATINIAVLYPFPHIACGIVQPKGISCK